MTLDAIVENLPPHARDLKVNLSMVLRQADLTPLQLWGTAVAAAAASRNPLLLAAIRAEASPVLEPAMIEAALGASAIMSMNNIYFRFLHLVEHDKYSKIPSRLRMNSTRRHGASVVDFELWCLAVSAIHGCATCIQCHERTVRQRGVSEAAVLAAVRIASVIHAVAVVLDASNPVGLA